MPIVLSQRIDKHSDYDDVPFYIYHFPKRYRNQLNLGDVFIYYQGDRWKKENRYYFGVGIIGAINVSSDQENYYAHILEGTAFSNKVPIYNPTGGFYESIAYNSVRNREKPPWQSSVRPISDSAFEAIIKASGVDSSDIVNSSFIEKENDPIKVIELLNDKYKDFTPHKKETFIKNHIDRGESVTNSLKKILGPKCQICDVEGFEKYNGGRYIEAHHISQLAKAVPDSLCSENVILLCPNCHREIHYGKEVLISDKGEYIFLQLSGLKKNLIHKNTVNYLRSLL